MSSQLKAFGAVGYYLNDTDYAIYEAQILNNIKENVVVVHKYPQFTHKNIIQNVKNMSNYTK